MTAVGVTSLEIAWSELQARPRDRVAKRAIRRFDDDDRSAVKSGLAWLGHHFGFEEKTPHGAQRGPHLYYLYGLERVGVLADVHNLGTHDWYREGAERLLDVQDAKGFWHDKGLHTPPPVGTSFAIPFLTRATTPVKTATSGR